MALSNPTTTSSFTNFLETRWSPRIMLDTSEEMAIANKFMTGSDLEVDKVGNTLYVRKVAAKTTNKPGSGFAGELTALTLENDSETAVACSPVTGYCAVIVSDQVKMRMMAFPAYEAAIRQQFVRSLSEQIDADAGTLATSLSVSVPDTNLSAALIRQALGTLKTNAKREYKTGKITAVLRVHSSQQQHLYGIPEAANADIRSDDGANVSGVVVKLWGADVDVTGNIASSGGLRYNMLFVKPAFALVYNQEPKVVAPQEFGFATFIGGIADYSVTEIYDNYGLSIPTAA